MGRGWPRQGDLLSSTLSKTPLHIYSRRQGHCPRKVTMMEPILTIVSMTTQDSFPMAEVGSRRDSECSGAAHGPGVGEDLGSCPPNSGASLRPHILSLL
jgi:hypothetical protein